VGTTEICYKGAVEPTDDEVEVLDPQAVFGERSPCFGCSPSHPIGLHLSFERRGDVVSTRFTPGEQYQGPPGVLHGGLVTTLADELAAWTVIGLRGRMGFTASLSGRLRAPLRIGREIEGTGRITRDLRRLLDVEVELAQDGEVAFTGAFTFAVLDRRGAEKMLQAPLPEAWQRFCR